MTRGAARRCGAGATAVAAAALLASGTAGAGEVLVNPDRPHITDTPDAVPRGLVELDSGVTFLRDASGGRPLRRFTTQSLLRVGLAENLEARVESTQFVRERSEGQGSSGLGDTRVGFKWHLVDDARWRAALALQPFVKLPTASRGKGLGSGRTDLGAFPLAGKDLPGDLEVEMNFGLAGVGLAEAPGGLFLQKTATASLTWALMDRIFPLGGDHLRIPGPTDRPPQRRDPIRHLLPPPPAGHGGRRGSVPGGRRRFRLGIPFRAQSAPGPAS